MIGLLSFSIFSLINDNIFASLEKKLVLGRVDLKKFALQDPLYSSDLVLNLDIHYLALLGFLIVLSVFLLSLKTWARSFFLFIIFIILIISSQILFLVFDINLYIIKDRIAGEISHGQKQWLEIGMLLSQNPKLMLIDEPAAGMTQTERHQTVSILKNIAKNVKM